MHFAALVKGRGSGPQRVAPDNEPHHTLHHVYYTLTSHHPHSPPPHTPHPTTLTPHHPHSPPPSHPTTLTTHHPHSPHPHTPPPSPRSPPLTPHHPHSPPPSYPTTLIPTTLTPHHPHLAPHHPHTPPLSLPTTLTPHHPSPSLTHPHMLHACRAHAYPHHVTVSPSPSPVLQSAYQSHVCVWLWGVSNKPLLTLDEQAEADRRGQPPLASTYQCQCVTGARRESMHVTWHGSPGVSGAGRGCGRLYM